GHGEHGHLPFLAHHFDDPEQQFDSGKLGMWLFLVTEVLFFSGMFCAYALYRSLHPEVWTFSSQFLNETLGAFNTGVLLFSSLTMAWGVRCAQLRQRTGLVVCLAMTLGCAAIFLGVKAIEYTHKWELGLLPAGAYESQFLPGIHHEGISSWLYVLSAVPALCAVGFAGWYLVSIIKQDKRTAEIAGPLLVTALCYFLGVYIGIVFESAEAAKHEDQHASSRHVAATDDAGHAEESEHEAGAHDDAEAAAEHEAVEHHQEAGSTTDTDDHAAASEVASGHLVVIEAKHAEPGAPQAADIDQAGGAGLFFSIYYCMTGVHAIHIIGGMIVLTWLLVRATKDQFNEQYFGPVDYVGLYWHLVDLI
ncbi:MAG: cytochrome c oxidase subunit 3, partial [Anaerolineae bacterium]|nr:cytochrome c oxidase subunit 3 [Anaerolineae bacterium]